MLTLAQTSCITLGLVAGSLSGAHAAYREITIHDTTTTVEIDLNATTVLCSSTNYVFLTAALPQLTGLTLLDHGNVDTGTPAVNAGFCAQGNMPENVIDTNEPTDEVDVRVRALHAAQIDEVANTCDTYFSELVRVQIRGVEFAHQTFVATGPRPVTDCMTIASPVGTDSGGKTDGMDTSDRAEAGGCSSAPGTSSGSCLLALSAVVCVRRRRRNR